MDYQTLTTEVRLVNDKVQFSGISRANEEVKMDYFPPFGEGDGYTGLEMLLLSLSCCSGTAVAVLLRKMGRTVAGMKIDARGIRHEELPKAFTSIDLSFRIVSPDATEAEAERAIDLAEKSMCPVWAMIRGNVTVTPSFSLCVR